MNITENQESLDITKVIEILKNCSAIKNINVDKAIEEELWEMYNRKELVLIAPTLISVNDRHFSYAAPAKNEDEVRFICANIWKVAGNYRIVSET